MNRMGKKKHRSKSEDVDKKNASSSIRNQKTGNKKQETKSLPPDKRKGFWLKRFGMMKAREYSIQISAKKDVSPLMKWKKIWERALQKIRNFGKHVKKVLPALLHCTWKAVCIVFTLVTGICVLLWIWKFHSPLLLSDLGLYDEGVTLLGAKRLANGEIPYRDFFTIYGPLKFSLLGGVFSVFGTSLYVSRIFFMIVSLAGFLALFLFFLWESNVFLAVIFTIFLALFGKFSLTPLFLMLTALWFSALLKKPESRFLPFFGGILVGLLFLLRIDFGGFIGFILFFLLSLFFIFSKRCSAGLFASILGKMLASSLLVVIPVFIALASAQALSEFYFQGVHFPLFGTYRELRHLPWSEMASLTDPIREYSVDFLELSKNFTWFFWPIPFLCAAGFWIFRGIQKSFHLESFLKNMLLGSFALAGFLYASHRSDFGHVVFLNLLSAIFLLHLLLKFKNKCWGLLFIPVFFLLSLYPTHLFLKTRESLLIAEKKEYSFFPTPFPFSEENDDLQKTLDFFSRVPADEKVYVGVKDTSRIFVNNVMLPFLLDQRVATKYHELHTGIVTTLPIQQEMIDELQDVRYVVLWDLFICEPNDGCISTGVYDLDEYIKSHFVKAETYGKYEIYLRKS